MASWVIKAFTMHASCSEQVLFSQMREGKKVPISHDEPVPDPELQCHEPPIIVGSMFKDILVAKVYPDDFEPTGEFEAETLTQDSHLGRGGLVKAGFNGYPAHRKSKGVTRLHELEDGQRYIRLPEDSFFNGWQRTESEIMEEEVGRAIVSYAESQGVKLRELPRKLFNAHKRPIQEWDAAYYDDATNTLYLAEAKHNMRMKDINKVTDHINGLEDAIARTVTEEYVDMNPSSIKVVLASGCYLDTAELQEAHERGYFLCYPSGDRYCIQPSHSPVVHKNSAALYQT
jgi:hypothetical protein